MFYRYVRVHVYIFYTSASVQTFICIRMPFYITLHMYMQTYANTVMLMPGHGRMRKHNVISVCMCMLFDASISLPLYKIDASFMISYAHVKSA